MKKAMLFVMSFLLVFSLFVPLVSASAEKPKEYNDLLKSTTTLAADVIELYAGDATPLSIVAASLDALDVVIDIAELSIELSGQLNSALNDWVEAHLLAYNLSLEGIPLALQLTHQLAQIDPANGISIESRKEQLVNMTDNLITAFDRNIESANKLLDEHSVWFVFHKDLKRMVEETSTYSEQLKEVVPDLYDLYQSLRK